MHKGGITGAVGQYDRCQRRFWFKYILNWRKKGATPALIDGNAKHVAISTYYKTGSPEEMLDTYIKIMEENQKEVIWTEKYPFALAVNRGTDLLSAYIEQYHPEDLKKYELVESEVSHIVDIDGFKLEFIPDRIMREKSTNQLILFEVKCTGYSAPTRMEQVMNGDQITCYMVLYEKLLGEKISYAVVEVLYHNKSVIKIIRSPEFMRSEREKHDFLQGLNCLTTEIIQKSCSSHGNERELYRRAVECDAGGYKCDYRDLCRINFNIDVPPIGFKYKEKRKRK